MPTDTAPPLPRVTFTPEGLQEPHPVIAVDPRALKAGYRTLPIREHLKALADARVGWFEVWGPRGVAVHAPIPNAVCPACGSLVPVKPHTGPQDHPLTGPWHLTLPYHLHRGHGRGGHGRGADWWQCRGARVDARGAFKSGTSGAEARPVDHTAETWNLLQGSEAADFGPQSVRSSGMTWSAALTQGRHPTVREAITKCLDTYTPGDTPKVGLPGTALHPRALLAAGYRGASSGVTIPGDGVAWELLLTGLPDAPQPMSTTAALSRAIIGMPLKLLWDRDPALLSAVFDRESVVGLTAGMRDRAGATFPPVGAGGYTLPHVVTHASAGDGDATPRHALNIGPISLYLHPLAFEVVAVALRMALSPPPPGVEAQAIGWVDYQVATTTPTLYLTPFGEERFRACLAACLLALGVMVRGREYPTVGDDPRDYATRITEAWATVQLAPPHHEEDGAVTRALAAVMAPWVAYEGVASVARIRWRGYGEGAWTECPVAHGFKG